MDHSERDQLINGTAEDVTMFVESGDQERIILRHIDDAHQQREIVKTGPSHEVIEARSISDDYHLYTEIFDEFHSNSDATNCADISLAFGSEPLSMTSNEEDRAANPEPYEFTAPDTVKINDISDDMDISDQCDIETLHMRDEDSDMDTGATSGSSVRHSVDDGDSGIDTSLLSETSCSASHDDVSYTEYISSHEIIHINYHNAVTNVMNAILGRSDSHLRSLICDFSLTFIMDEDTDRSRQS